jgi:uncharacterized membrane protein
VTEEDETSKPSEHRIDRVLAISDGVFAFAVTLLVLDLAVPVLYPGSTSSDLLNALSREYVSFLNYLLSFFIAGIWWNAHHRNFERIRKSDSTLRWLNLLFLLWIALLPFFTKILDQYSTIQAAVVLYAADQTAAGIFLALGWWYASRNHRLIDPNMKKSEIRFVSLIHVIAPSFFVISMSVSVISPVAATQSWFVMLPVLFLAHRLHGRNKKKRELHEPTDE